MQDVRYALRLIRRHPGFSAVAILTLALGAFGVTRLTTFMFGISPTAPATFALAASLLPGVAILATLLPGLRLTRLAQRRSYAAADQRVRSSRGTLP